MTAKELGLMRYKMRFRILEELEAHEPPLSLNDIAEQAGITLQAVRRTFFGELHSERVLNAFRNADVSKKYLFDPRKHGVRMRGYGLSKKKTTVVADQ